MKSLLLLFALALLSRCSAFAQPELWEVYSTSNQPFVNVTIEKFQSDSLYMKSMDRTMALHQDSIKYVLRRKESQFGTGFLIGSIVGALTLTLLSEEADISEMNPTVLGSLIGGTFGGIIGIAYGSDEKYRIDKLSSEKRRSLLSRRFPDDEAAE